MMFGFENCTKRFAAGQEVHLLLDNATLRFTAKERVVVLGAAGSGKSSLLRLISGADKPSLGTVRVPSMASWPIGFAGFFHPVMSGEQNIRTLSAMMQVDADRAAAFVDHFAELGSKFHRPVQEYSAGMRARLAVAYSMAVPFSFYLADDNIGTGDKSFRAKCDAMMDIRLRDAGLFFTTSNSRLAERYGERFIVLHDRKLIECDSLQDAKLLLETVRDDEEQFSTLFSGLQSA